MVREKRKLSDIENSEVRDSDINKVCEAHYATVPSAPPNGSVKLTKMQTNK